MIELQKVIVTAWPEALGTVRKHKMLCTQDKLNASMTDNHDAI